MLFNPVYALESFRDGEPLTDDVYEGILEARREEARYEAEHDIHA